MKGKIVYMVAVLLLVSAYSFSLELDNGKIRLVLHKNIGRYSVYYLSDPGKNKYTSYFLDQDVRTSVISLVVDNKIYRLGESGSFKETIEETSNGARFVWKARQLEVSEDFSFISLSGSGETDGILITFEITNISEKTLNVGIRYLFDTYLGESHNHHFKTNTNDNITNETVIEKNTMIDYWISQNIKTEDAGLQVITGSSKVTRPDKIVFANWKRLNETTWTYLSSESRDFSSRPYSINDSAVCHYYNPSPLKSGKTRKITLLLGNVSKSLSGDLFTGSDLDWIENGDDTLKEQIASDITILENLLVMINKKINSGELISDKDISIMEQILEEIKIHLDEYKNK